MAKRETAGQSSGGQESKMRTARDAASTVARGAAQAGGKMSHTATEQGRQVAAETGHQIRNLVGEASSDLRRQARYQQQRTAGGLRKLGDELQAMSDQSDGMAGHLVRRASGAACQAADWLEHREPGAVVNDVRDFARRHPGVFLAGAVFAGAIAGRMTRSLAGADGMRRGAAEQGAQAPDISGMPEAAAPPPHEPAEQRAEERPGAYQGPVAP